MKTAKTVTGLIAATMLLAGCAADDQPENDAPETTTAAAVKGTELPIETLPEQIGQGDMESQCPYIDGEWLQNATGQKLMGVGVDNRFDPAACVFWSYEDESQATVMVRHMTTNEDAVAVVDHAAPIDTTQKALKPEGWSGGRGGGESFNPDPDNGPGAVYAVWKDETAVVVFTAQEQSFKAEEIATEAIKNLEL